MSVIIEVAPTALLVENTLFTLSAALYVLAAVFHVLLLSGKKKAGLIADLVFKTGFLLHTAFIVTRGINVRRVPLSDIMNSVTLYLGNCIALLPA